MQDHVNTTQINKLKQLKEKWEEFKNIFQVDKNIYRLLKKEQSQHTDVKAPFIIPELFIKKYPQFEYLHNKQVLDLPNAIYYYIHYMPLAEKKTYSILGKFNINITELANNSLKCSVYLISDSKDLLDSTDDSLDGTDDSIDGTDDSLEGTDDSLEGTDDFLEGTDDSLEGTDDFLDGSINSACCTALDLPQPSTGLDTHQSNQPN